MKLILRFMTRVQVVMAVLALAVLLTPPRAERYGDTLQVVLPVMAMACSVNLGSGTEYLLRYVTMFSLAHGTKNLLGDAQINQRPDGGGKGFPSAHTATAVLGASALVQDCLRNQPVAQAVVLLAAGFVGASRIEAGRHDIWQVLAGALLGWGCDRVLRRPSPQRERVRILLVGIGRRTGAVTRAVMAVVRPALLRIRAVIMARPGSR